MNSGNPRPPSYWEKATVVGIVIAGVAVVLLTSICPELDLPIARAVEVMQCLGMVAVIPASMR